MKKYTQEERNYAYYLYEAGFTYDEIAEEMKKKFGIVFKKNIRSDHFKKGWSGTRYNDLQQIIFLEKHTKDYKINEESEYHNIAKARQKLLVERKINVKVNNDMHASANKLAFRELILRAIEKVGVDNQMQGKKYQDFKIIDNQKVKRACFTPIYFIADEHYRGNIDDWQVAHLWKEIAKDCYINKYEKIIIVNLGDNIEGLLHKSSMQTNDGAIISSIKYVNETAHYINEINKTVAMQIYWINESNHGQTRTLNTKRDELAREDLGLMIAELLKAKLNINIDFIANNEIKFNANGKDFFCIHGHQSFAGTKQGLTNWLEANNIIPDFICLGHFHNFKLNQFGVDKYLLSCPAVKSFTSSYENNKGFKLNPSIIKLENNYGNLKVSQIKIKGVANE